MIVFDKVQITVCVHVSFGLPVPHVLGVVVQSSAHQGKQVLATVHVSPKRAVSKLSVFAVVILVDIAVASHVLSQD